VRADGLLRSELSLVFRRTRTLVVLGILALTPVLLAVAWWVGGDPVGTGPLVLADPSGSGLLTGVFTLAPCVPLLLPLAVAVVAGESLAGEAAAGTLRGLLVAGTGRTRLLLVKFTTTALFAVVAVLVVLGAGTAAGAALFGVHDLALATGGQLSVRGALLRLGLVAVYAAISLLGAAAVGTLLSALSDVPVTAVAGTMILVLTAQLAAGLGPLSAVAPWLFTTPWTRLDQLLLSPPDWAALAHNGIVQGAYLAGAGLLAWARFAGREVPVQ
jgi:ABC-2 type transport system permease protein